MKSSANLPVTGSSEAAVADVGRERMDIEQVLAFDDETRFYLRQRDEWEEIAQFLSVLDGDRLGPDSEVAVPSGERPAYLEWSCWRAFLAINTLCNEPYEARKFAVDQDMRPLGHAPGGGPDLVFEFEDCVVVVEVTLSTSVRQEAMEAVPVRHHVYQVQSEFPEKRVLGLFIAPRLMRQTVHTFQAQEWYPDGAEDPVEVLVVPATLSQFRALFEAMFQGGEAEPSVVLSVIDDAIAKAPTCPTPVAWEEAVNRIFERETSRLAPG